MSVPLAKLENLFRHALELPVAPRRRWLNDLAVRDRDSATALRALLEAHDSESPLDAPAQLDGERAMETCRRPDPESLVGTRVAGYAIRRSLGAGGMGDVFEALQETPARRVAFKALREATGQAGALRRFMSEIDTLAKLDHPQIARVLGGGAWPEPAPWSAWCAMELVEDAVDILTFAERSGLDREQRVRLFLPVCDAVHHAHRRGFLHRDLKPQNLLGSTTRPLAGIKVIDFGIARSMRVEVDTNPTDPRDASAPDATGRPLQLSHAERTRAGELVGTPLYMSPEQAVAEPGDVRSDVYSLGVVLFELLVGEHPIAWEGLSLGDVLDHIRRGRLRSAAALGPAMPKELVAILARATATDPDARYDSAAELEADLQRWLGGFAVQAVGGGIGYRLQRLAVRRRKSVVLAASLLVLFVAGVVAMGVLWRRSEDALAGYRAAEARATLARTEFDDVQASLRAAAKQLVEQSSQAVRTARSRGESRRIAGETYQRLVELDPALRADFENLEPLAEAYVQVASLHGSEWFAQEEDARTGCDAIARAVDVRRAIYAAKPRDAAARDALTRALCELVHSLRKTGRLAEGAGPADEAVGHARDGLQEQPESAAAARLLITALWARSDLNIHGDPMQGRLDAEGALAVAKKLVEGEPERSDLLVWSQFRLGLWLSNAPKTDVEARAEAWRLARAASDAVLLAYQVDPSEARRLDLQTVVQVETHALEQAERIDEARERAQAAMDVLAADTADARIVSSWTQFALQWGRLSAEAERREMFAELGRRWSRVSEKSLVGLGSPDRVAQEMLEAGVPMTAALRPLFETARAKVRADLVDASPAEAESLRVVGPQLQSAIEMLESRAPSGSSHLPKK